MLRDSLASGRPNSDLEQSQITWLRFDVANRMRYTKLPARTPQHQWRNNHNAIGPAAPRSSQLRTIKVTITLNDKNFKSISKLLPLIKHRVTHILPCVVLRRPHLTATSTPAQRDSDSRQNLTATSVARVPPFCRFFFENRLSNFCIFW